MFYNLQKLRAFGSRPCLLHQDRWITYADLADEAGRFGQTIPGNRALVAIEMTAEPGAISAYIGALAAGHAVVPLPANDPIQAQMVEQRFHPAASWRRRGDRPELLLFEDAASVHPDLALMLQTSGSTGQGRGVRLSSSAVQSNAAAIVEYLRIGPGDRAALVLPLHYSYGLSVLHSHLLAGASIWLSDTSVLEPRFAADLRASGATSLAGVPHHFQMLESSFIAETVPQTLDCLTVAGGAMEPAAVRRWAARMNRQSGRFVVMYGQTEATARIAYLPSALAIQHSDAVGRAIPGGALVLRDATGREITAATAEGELVYRGPNVMMGYADTAADLIRGQELTELATGDMAQRDADGLYRITGRLSRMSKIAGLRIGHDALERALADTGNEVAVWGDDETIRIAARGRTDGIVARAAALTQIGRQHFTIVPCEVFPRRANGKIDYPALKRLEAPPVARDDVLSAFALTFGAQPVTFNSSFNSLGGDSLQHVELSLSLDRILGNAPLGWEDRSVADLQRSQITALSRMPMAVLVRALAILAVVVAHQTLWPIHGGAAAMMLLFGMSVAGPRRQTLIDGDARAFLAPAGRVVVPYLLVLAGFALAWGQVPWVSVFMVGNFAVTTPETGLMLPYLYWFIEVYVQITLLILLVSRPAWVRRRIAAAPLVVGLTVLALAFASRLALPVIWPMAGREQFTLPWVFHLFALGWCVATAETQRQRLTVMASAAVILPVVAWLGGSWIGSWTKYLGLLGVVALLLYLPHARLPRRLRWVTMHLAQAAFPIYLLHRLVPEVILPRIAVPLNQTTTDIIAVLGGIALGLAAAQLQRVLLRRSLIPSMKGLPWRLPTVFRGQADRASVRQSFQKP